MTKTVNKGTMILYLNVGQLAPAEADAFVDKMKERIKDWVDVCKQEGYQFVAIPIRDQPTHIEKMLF